MKKVLAIAAMATLAMSSDATDMSETELNFLKSLGNGAKKAGKFVVEHPKIVTTAAKVLALDEHDDEFPFYVDNRSGKSTHADDADNELMIMAKEPRRTAHADDADDELMLIVEKPRKTTHADDADDELFSFLGINFGGSKDSKPKPVPIEKLTKTINPTTDNKREFAKWKQETVENEDIDEESFNLFVRLLDSKAPQLKPVPTPTTKSSSVPQKQSQWTQDGVTSNKDLIKGRIRFEDEDNEFRHDKGRPSYSTFDRPWGMDSYQDMYGNPSLRGGMIAVPRTW